MSGGCIQDLRVNDLHCLITHRKLGLFGSKELQAPGTSPQRRCDSIPCLPSQLVQRVRIILNALCSHGVVARRGMFTAAGIYCRGYMLRGYDNFHIAWHFCI